ncbi:hypothetical protein TTHERM_00285580 (macronuclear) [Tetrahymena thermophila SB210]|uniref:Cyclic nucleotide-binding domain-containing protein n=1 Tax=Tetrahymena thermophila (strain SB210) TaxID=312017 RepID=I7MKF4_TETTS|nr:hypothetical protein TTHERM_00285580 [Tetrahymena thermophila SB210]EAR98327.2 hypothetical protein TTHERM_00285580 [Tetrahymena thermophila SB210]|eukprot:XP_001018572.2 hypothetical protein TTHERM_00285580 [Tetrahymena thermophila SB210]
MIENCIKILQRQSNVSDMKDRAIVADFLSHIPYLKGVCSKQELQDRLFDLAQYVEYEEIPEYSAVFHKGEQSQYLYFILKGNISVFIPKSSQDIELEVKWRQKLEYLNNEYKDSKHGNQHSQQSSQQIINQINQGKSILKCLRNQEDEELLRNKYFSKYFRQSGTICGFKKITQLYEYDSFGESILSDQSQKRTATLIAHNGIPLRQTNKQVNNQEINIVSDDQEESNTLRLESTKKLEANYQIQPVKEIIIQSQENQDILDQHQQAQNLNLDNQLQTLHTISNHFQISKFIILGKISKKNYLKVFQQELEKRTFVRRALLNNFQKDLNQDILSSIAFFFKEEHLEKNQKIIKELESTNDSSKRSSNNNSSSQKIEHCSTERKRAQEILENPIFSHPDQEEEFLYLLYKGSIEIQKKMTSNHSKSQIKNIDSSLQKNTMSRVSKLSLRLAQLSEGEFFGHENWFKEDFESMLSYVGQVSPSQAFQDKMIQLQKEFSIVTLETDTVIFKIPRKILCQYQNQNLLKSLIAHGNQRHKRYLQLYTEAVQKQEETILQKIKAENDYFISESHQQKQTKKFTSSNVENLMQENNNKINNKAESNKFFQETHNDLSPFSMKDLVSEFNSFKMKFDNVYNTAAIQPIINKQIQSHKRVQSQIQIQQDSCLESQDNNRNTQHSKSYHASAEQNPIIRQRSTLIFTSNNLNAIESQHPQSLHHLETEEGEKPPSSLKKIDFVIRQNQRQRSMYNISKLSEKSLSNSQSQLNLNKQFSNTRDLNQVNFDSSNYFDFKEKRGTINKQNIANSQQISRNASLNSSPNHKSSFEQGVNQDIYEIKVKAAQNNKQHQMQKQSDFLISDYLSQNQLIENKKYSNILFGSQTQRNISNQDENYFPQSPSIIKSLNLSPRKVQNHKNTHSIINLKKIQNEQSQNKNYQQTQSEMEVFKQLEQNDNNSNNFTEICSKYNQLQDKDNENQLNSIEDQSPNSKKVKFLLQLPSNSNDTNKKQTNQVFPLRLQNLDIRQKIKFLDSMKKKCPQLKNSFLNQINIKKQIFKNDSLQQYFNNYEQPNSNISQQINLCRENSLSKLEFSKKEQNSTNKLLSGFLSSRNSDEILNLHQNDFKTASEQINNIIIDRKSLFQRQNSQKTFHSNQNSPKNNQKKIKTFSIHQNSQSNLFQNNFQPQKSLMPLPNKFSQFLKIKTSQQPAQLGGSQTERQFEISQISPFTSSSQESSLKQEIQSKSFKIFEDLSHRNSEQIFDEYETKIHSGQDLDQNMLSYDTAANSYDQFNPPLKPVQQFSQFKIQKQIIADVSKKSPSKQIIQNCFKKK